MILLKDFDTIWIEKASYDRIISDIIKLIYILISDIQYQVSDILILSPLFMYVRGGTWSRLRAHFIKKKWNFERSLASERRRLVLIYQY